MTIRAAPRPTLSAALVRRRRTLALPAPSMPAPCPIVPTPEPARGWSDDLRFFVTCYAAGVVFFFIMLS